MKSTQKKVSGAPIPTRMDGFVFAAKASLLQFQRTLKNIFNPLPRSKPHTDFPNKVLLSQSVSLLRFHDEETALALVDGKIHNIRIAIKNLDGIVVRKGEIFSFWHYVGKLTKAKGYVLGRELREGCIIPAIGGGICQLSNAIYDAASKAGLEIAERHRHTAVIKGSLAEAGRDATVFWNYVDLRLKGSQDWQLQVKMDKERLTVSIFGEQKNTAKDEAEINCAPTALGDCTWCGRTDCYLHAPNMPSHSHKTYLSIDEEFVEFTEWRKKNIKKEDRLISAAHHASLGTQMVNFFSKLLRRYYLWLGKNELKRAEKLSKENARYIYSWRKYPIPVAHNARYRMIARHFAKKLKYSDTYLVIPQQLLVWLYLDGELAGRQYDVLMSAMPMPKIEQQLDEAMERYGFKVENGYYKAVNDLNPCGEAGVTLGDFRAPKNLIEAEKDALAGASSFISPHVKILEWSGKKGVALDWILPSPAVSVPEKTAGFKILLAGVNLGRKGIFDLRTALRKIKFDYELLLAPSAIESEDFWQGFNVRAVKSINEGVSLCDAVVLPAVVEHNPRGILLAIASQKTVIASSACGLPASLNWKRADNAEELERCLNEAFAGRK
ncbi:MAG: VanW family protein [Endomicrobia bacterium]|nr:VanW family protein [Endomicrobiia bacterium]